MGEVRAASKRTEELSGVTGWRFSLLASAALFFFALVVYWPVLPATNPVPAGPESIRIARSLIESGQFADPFNTLKTGPTAHLAPAFPIYLAILFKIFGLGSRGLTALELSGTVAICAQVALLPIVGRCLSLGTLAGAIAGCLWLVAKPQAIYIWEGYYVAGVLAIACCVYRRCLDEDLGAERFTWIFGLIAGLIVLLNPAIGSVLIIYIFWKVVRDGRTALKRSLPVLILVPAILISPWIIRNYRVFHRFVPIRDNLGLELLVSNNDCAQITYLGNARSRCFQAFHPNANAAVAEEVVQLGEPEFSSLCLSSAESWMLDHPTRFIDLTANRFLAFWFPPAEESGFARSNWITRFMVYLLTVSSIGGIVLLYRKDRKSATIFVILLVIFPLLYYVDQWDYRYRCPILWATFLTGSFPLTRATERLLMREPRKLKADRKRSQKLKSKSGY